MVPGRGTEHAHRRPLTARPAWGDGGLDVLDDETRPDGRRHVAVWARTLMIVPLGSSTKKRRTPHGSSLSA
jgi:hypothetical protein